MCLVEAEFAEREGTQGAVCCTPEQGIANGASHLRLIGSAQKVPSSALFPIYDRLDRKQQVWRSLFQMNLPEVSYFLETFIPSFRLTIDELN